MRVGAFERSRLVVYGKIFFRSPGHFKNFFWGLKVTKNWEFWVWYLWKFNVEFSTPSKIGRKMMLKSFFLVFLKLFLELRYGSRNFKTHILPFYRSTIEIWSTVNGHIEELVIIWLPEDDYPSPWGGPYIRFYTVETFFLSNFPNNSKNVFLTFILYLGAWKYDLLIQNKIFKIIHPLKSWVVWERSLTLSDEKYTF